MSNISILVRPDGKYEAINRNGDIATADSLLGDWEVRSTRLWWNVDGMPSDRVEDPVIWYSDGLYHCVANKWDAKQAYYLTSEDGLTGWVRHSGIAYSPKTPFLQYEDGTVNNWTKLERPNVYIEDGSLKAVTFAVIDVEKEEDFGNDEHGSKIIVVPFDGTNLAEFARNDVYVDPLTQRPGLEPSADTTIQSWKTEASKNYGAEEFLQIQRNAEQGIFGEGEKQQDGYDCKIAFLKYDLSEFESEADINDAWLSVVYQSKEAGDAAEDEIMVVTQNGVVSRIKADCISRQGRPATGVKIQNLSDGDMVCTINKIVNTDSDEDTAGAESTAQADATPVDNSIQQSMLDINTEENNEEE